MFDVKTLCGVPGSETPPVLEVSAYGLRCLSRREREREWTRVSFDEKEYLKTHGERERSESSSVQKLGSLLLFADAKNRKIHTKHTPAAAARLNPPRARANTCSSL